MHDRLAWLIWSQQSAFTFLSCSLSHIHTQSSRWWQCRAVNVLLINHILCSTPRELRRLLHARLLHPKLAVNDRKLRLVSLYHVAATHSGVNFEILHVRGEELKGSRERQHKGDVSSLSLYCSSSPHARQDLNIALFPGMLVYTSCMKVRHSVLDFFTSWHFCWADIQYELMKQSLKQKWPQRGSSYGQSEHVWKCISEIRLGLCHTLFLAHTEEFISAIN